MPPPILGLYIARLDLPKDVVVDSKYTDGFMGSTGDQTPQQWRALGAMTIEGLKAQRDATQGVTWKSSRYIPERWRGTVKRVGLKGASIRCRGGNGPECLAA